jgi:hypothetical protein
MGLEPSGSFDFGWRKAPTFAQDDSFLSFAQDDSFLSLAQDDSVLNAHLLFTHYCLLFASFFRYSATWPLCSTIVVENFVAPFASATKYK